MKFPAICVLTKKLALLFGYSLVNSPVLAKQEEPMASLYRIIVGVSWSLGVLGVLGSVVLKLIPAWRELVNTDSPHWL